MIHRDDFRSVIIVDDTPSALEMAKALQCHPALRPHEARFVDRVIQLAGGRRGLSWKQSKWLRDLYVLVNGAEN
jgi:hypothetical protein